MQPTQVEIFNHYPANQHPSVETYHKLLAAQAQAALLKVWQQECGPDPSNLESPCVEVSLVDDPCISRLHKQFMADPSPTDVITFRHGEIFISIDTAVRQAHDNTETVPQELLRYLVHGLLHLRGYLDQTPTQKQQMTQIQEEILAELLAESIAN